MNRQASSASFASSTLLTTLYHDIIFRDKNWSSDDWSVAHNRIASGSFLRYSSHIWNARWTFSQTHSIIFWPFEMCAIAWRVQDIRYFHSYHWSAIVTVLGKTTGWDSPQNISEYSQSESRGMSVQAFSIMFLWKWYQGICEVGVFAWFCRQDSLWWWGFWHPPLLWVRFLCTQNPLHTLSFFLSFNYTWRTAIASSGLVFASFISYLIAPCVEVAKTC